MFFIFYGKQSKPLWIFFFICRLIHLSFVCYKETSKSLYFIHSSSQLPCHEGWMLVSKDGVLCTVWPPSFLTMEAIDYLTLQLVPQLSLHRRLWPCHLRDPLGSMLFHLLILLTMLKENLIYKVIVAMITEYTDWHNIRIFLPLHLVQPICR